ncbi:MAG: dipeptide epimerase [Deltaproteobacteria bacterium]|nr:dipeptide epimerase [Deltaproteobacteria bacterium]
MRLVELTIAPLSVPLLEPFVIATATMTHTRAALVRAVVEGRGGLVVVGLGEAAALPPVTREDQPELVAELTRAAPRLEGRSFDLGTVASLLAEVDLGPVARAALECALLDAAARLATVPLHRLLGSTGAPCALVTDITLPIADPEHLAHLARGYRERGFEAFKIKVGKSLEGDRAVLGAVARALPEARIRLDANEGYDANEALGLLVTARELGLVVECFEQPCAREAPTELAQVTREGGVPVVADESCRSLGDLEAIASGSLAHAVNLKLVKLGGVAQALAVGRRARALGLGLMAGAMVETRLGLSAMAQVVTALGGVDWLDLDTAFLLAEDPFKGGYVADGARLTLCEASGLGVDLA